MRARGESEMKSKVMLVLLAILAFACATRSQAQVVVIANPGVKAASVSKGDLRDVFNGASSTLAGSRVAPVLLKAGPAKDAFLSQYIGKSDAAFMAGWRNQVFSGQGSMPKTVDSDAAMVEYVVHTPGAIGYVSSSAPHEGVKVLEVR
jgi:ABC-type phosphate transport system substrate-binding protein